MAAFFETPRGATNEEIHDIIRRFGRSAAICEKASFSGVQIHGAHAYLVSQFLSPHHNQQTDHWGEVLTIGDALSCPSTLKFANR